MKLWDEDHQQDIPVAAQIWDTSGSERYRSIVTGHYRAAVGAVLVFDLTERDTFDCLEHWLKELRDNCDEHCQVALVANKVDLINADPTERKVSKQEIESFVETNELVFVGETSAKEDINIKETFETLLERVHAK